MRAKTMLSILAVSVFVLGFSGAGLCQGSGSISGIVEDESGTAVPGAWVVYNDISKPVADGRGSFKPAGPNISASLQADGGGRFLIAPLGEADYYLCALKVAPNQLNSCEWGGEYLRVHVQAGRDAGGNVLRLRRGTLVRVQVDDPTGQIAAGKKLLVGVISDKGYYRRAERLANGPKGEVVYGVAVPRGIPVRLFLDVDAGLGVSDQGGQPLASRRPSLPITVGAEDEVRVYLSLR